LGADEFDVLQSFYGFEWDTRYGYDGVMPGEYYFELYAIELKAGPAIVQPRVFDLQGQPAEGVLLWFSWPGAEPLDLAVHPRYKETGVHGWTDSNGSCGWSYGGESHIGPNGGPYTAWCNSGEGYLGSLAGSDALDRIGWWDDHITPNPWFRVTRKGGEVAPPDDEYRLAALDADGNVLGYVYFKQDEPPVGENGMFALLDGNNNILAYTPWE
jgi:hypothetical protein